MPLSSIQYRGVYKLRDGDLRLHPDPDGRPIGTKARYFVVLSNREVCQSAEWHYVVGCPTSTDPNHVTEYCVEAPRGSGNLPEDCWIRVPAIQPLDKSVLFGGDFCGELKGDPRKRLEEVVVDMIGLL
ncbi:type II toxin-antitoxin system PemK/MazF family toxin [Mycobacterium sp. DL592]|uniref:type II toxin-antitoxin system PemK/MazF family toxin n=1 Tax=Mycobacterium sp. DL592 TaxID=2675524 RepID=UPI00141F0523|nr:type II toxin-antitoxin system PemK/MazF family toxin [Mycobacterium sp. DL592]